MGLEPTTLGTTIQCSNQLSYIHHLISWMDESFLTIKGVKDGTRTHDPWNHNPML